MSLDTQKIGLLAAQLMEAVQERYEGQAVRLGEAMLLVEVRRDRLQDPDGDFAATIEISATDERIWIQRGMLSAADEGLKLWYRIEERDDDEEP